MKNVTNLSIMGPTKFLVVPTFRVGPFTEPTRKLSQQIPLAMTIGNGPHVKLVASVIFDNRRKKCQPHVPPVSTNYMFSIAQYIGLLIYLNDA